MKSNMRLNKICSYCGKEFIAQTIRTKCCSDTCAKRFYKFKKKQEKIELNTIEVKAIKDKPLDEIRAKEFLTVREVAKLLNSSRQTIYNIINNGTLKATNISEKKTLVRRLDIERLFDMPTPVKSVLDERDLEYPLSDCYNLSEIKEKYGISDKGLSDAIKRYKIPKYRKGWFAFVPRILIDKMFSSDVENVGIKS
jgi:excisionase family DNA binding protein